MTGGAEDARCRKITRLGEARKLMPQPHRVEHSRQGFVGMQSAATQKREREKERKKEKKEKKEE